MAPQFRILNLHKYVEKAVRLLSGGRPRVAVSHYRIVLHVHTQLARKVPLQQVRVSVGANLQDMVRSGSLTRRGLDYYAITVESDHQVTRRRKAFYAVKKYTSDVDGLDWITKATHIRHSECSLSGDEGAQALKIMHHEPKRLRSYGTVQSLPGARGDFRSHSRESGSNSEYAHDPEYMPRSAKRPRLEAHFDDNDSLDKRGHSVVSRGTKDRSRIPLNKNPNPKGKYTCDSDCSLSGDEDERALKIMRPEQKRLRSYRTVVSLPGVRGDFHPHSNKSITDSENPHYPEYMPRSGKRRLLEADNDSLDNRGHSVDSSDLTRPSYADFRYQSSSRRT